MPLRYPMVTVLLVAISPIINADAVLNPSNHSNNKISQPLAKIETVVVTATGEARLRMDLPESVVTFDQSAIEAISPSHPSEVLNRAAGVHVNNLGGEGHMTAIRQPISTRGVYLFLEDGIPIRPSGFFNHNALYEINIPQSGNLEVTKGPGSALYGSDAIGGIINAISPHPPEANAFKVNVEAGSYGWRRGLLSVGTRQGDHGLSVSLNITDNEGYREESEYSRESLTGRWDYGVNDSLSVKTLFSYTKVDQSGASSLEKNDYKNNRKKNLYHGDVAFREVEALRLSSEFSWVLSEQSLLTMTPYYRDNTMTMAPSWMVTYDPNERESDFQSYGLMSKYRVNANENLLWIVGVDLDYSPSHYKEEAISYSQVGDIYSDYVSLGYLNYDFDAEQRSVSPYLHLEYQLTDKLLASMGLRYDDFTIDYDDKLSASHPATIFIPQLGRPVTHLRPESQEVSFDAFSPKWGLVYQANDKHSIYWNYREGFSIPSVGTLFRPGTTQYSDELAPIKATSYEIGSRGELASWLYYEITAYRMTIEDDIVSVVNGFQRNVYNAGETRHEGVELALNGTLSNEWMYAMAVSKTRQRYQSFSYTCCFPSVNVDVSGNDVGKAPETIANITLAYLPIALPGLRFELEWEHLGEYYTDETNTATYKGHDLYNLRVSYTVNESLEVYGRVQNLADERYSTYTSNQVGDSDISYRPGLPRSIFAGIRYGF